MKFSSISAGDDPTGAIDADAEAECVDWVDETDLIDDAGAISAAEDAWWMPDPAGAHDSAMGILEGLSVRARMLIADQYRVMAEVVREAEAMPEPWVGPDPTLDPDWRDVRERGVGAIRRDRRELAVRAAVADMAVRLRMAETTIRMRAAHAETLRERCPQLWSKFLGGQVSESHAVTAAQLAATLPEDLGSWAAFDDQVAFLAVRLTPGKFRTAARSIRERVHAESIEDRHRRAKEDRRVWLTPELDGMAVVAMLVPAADAYAAIANVDAHARHLHRQDDETRTLAQLRADVLIDLLARGASGGTAEMGDGKVGAGKVGAGKVAVALTIPAMTALGHGSEPAILDGYGPIDLETALRLAGSATAWVRVLTHPVTGTVLDVDRREYRVSNALRRWLGIRHPVCIFPGCNRLARDCDIDHSLDWQYGGTTSDVNLGPLCEPHHIVKHGTKWTLTRDPVTGAISWTSPTGFTTGADPAPF